MTDLPDNDDDVESMLDHYHRDEPDATSRLSRRADEYDSKEAFVEAMESHADEFTDSEHCKDCVVQYAETKNHETHYYHAKFAIVLETSAPSNWLPQKMQSIVRGRYQ